MMDMGALFRNGEVVVTCVDVSDEARRHASVAHWAESYGFDVKSVPFLALRDQIADSVAHWCKHAQGINEMPMAAHKGHFGPEVALRLFAAMTGVRL